MFCTLRSTTISVGVPQTRHSSFSEMLAADDLNQNLIAAVCMAIYQANPQGIPYGIRWDESGFSPETGAWNGATPYSGATCATFIMHVCANIGLSLITEDDWPRREDDREWQDRIVRVLEANGVEQAHCQAQLEVVGSARFRPCEVAAAASSLDAPLTHVDAIPRGVVLKDFVLHAM